MREVIKYFFCKKKKNFIGHNKHEKPNSEKTPLETDDGCNNEEDFKKRVFNKKFKDILDLKQKNEISKSFVQKETKCAPLDLNPLFDNKENYRNFLETGKKDFDQPANSDPNTFTQKKLKEEEKKVEPEDIYARKKRLAEVRDIILKKKNQERENIMKNYQKVFDVVKKKKILFKER